MMLDAGAEVVNLHSWGPHFYETGRHLVRLRHGEGPAMATSLVEVGPAAGVVCGGGGGGGVGDLCWTKARP